MTTYHELKAAGLCTRCRRDNDLGGALCRDCRQDDRLEREQRRAAGLCMYLHCMNWAVRERSKCRYHLDQWNESMRARRAA